MNVVRQSSMSCGDLIFSSHLIFVLGLTLVYTLWGRVRVLKAAAWAAALTISLLIVASRKHYSVDVVVAWYTVPLVFHALRGTARWKRLEGRPDAGLPEVGNGGAAANDGSGSSLSVVVVSGGGVENDAAVAPLEISAKGGGGAKGRARRWLGWLAGRDGP